MQILVVNLNIYLFWQDLRREMVFLAIIMEDKIGLKKIHYLQIKRDAKQDSPKAFAKKSRKSWRFKKI